MCIQHDLLALDAHSFSNLDRGCRLAALIYTNTLTREAPFQPVNSRLLSLELKSALGKTHLNEQNGTVLLWVLVLGAMVSSGTLERSFFRTKLWNLLDSLHISSWPQIHQSIRQIAWIDKVHEPLSSELQEEMFAYD